MLDDVNPYVESFRQAKDKFDSNQNEKFHMRIVSDRIGKDGRTYSMPTALEVAALIPGDFHPGMHERDIIVQEKNSGKLQRISEVHPSYLALQYPLIFPYGEDGFRVGIQKGSSGKKNDDAEKFISLRQWFAFRIQERENEAQTLLRSGHLFQQFLVDAYTTLESNRLKYIKYNQSNIRCENYASIKASTEAGNTKMVQQEKKIQIPASFTGGPRYMQQSYYDAMATCKQFGFPDIFITFTCNPKWPEIQRYLKKNKLNSCDRPDIMCRMFKIKLDSLMKDLIEDHLLGKTISAMYTVEFQKRGLPHAHILLFMDPSCKLPTADDIDKMIYAEIPDKDEDPELYEVVKECRIHGPCGSANSYSPCMVDGKCSKFFPKDNVEETAVGKDGYPIYRRREKSHFVEKNDIKCDNRYVVPYNRLLSLRYKTHINVEWCNQTGSIKYLFKYINKGQDRVAVIIEPKEKTSSTEGKRESATASTNTDSTTTNLADDANGKEVKKDEIKDYFDCRYVSASEAAWRLFKFPIQFRTTPVMKLPFHQPGKQPCFYNENDSIEDVLDRKANVDSMFMAYLKLNQVNQSARKYTYGEIPKYFTWDGKRKQWNPRKRGFSLGRIHYVPFKMEDEYYMRILLGIVPGPKSDEDIRTYKGVVYDTYRKACLARGILEDDQAYIDSILEASFWFFGDHLRNFFSLMLIDGCLSRPEYVWEKTWEVLSEDIERNKREEYGNPDLNLTDDEKRNYALQMIEELMLSNGHTLKSFEDMPQPSAQGVNHSNRFITEEMNYNRDTLKEDHDKWIQMLTSEQKAIYDEITEAVFQKSGGVFFVYGFGGTGKTFVWKTLSAAVRYRGLIAINVASSGIASLLLEGGRTTHSRFSIPITPDDFTMCNIEPTFDLANMLKEASLIIWDEAPMMSRYCFESLDRSLCDIIRHPEGKPFGGKVVVFGGDFRQVLPVIHGAGRAQIVLASLNSSYLWEHCKVLTLTKNMRLMKNGLTEKKAKEIKDFSEWILAVGDGKVAEPNDGEALIDIPQELLITDVDDPIEAISRAVYGNLDLLHQKNDPEFFQQRAILCPTNNDVNTINERLLAKLQGEEVVYLSADSIDPQDVESLCNPVFSSDFLNSIKLSGLPNHCLRLKIGAPVMLLRNIDPKYGLCNGTRLQISQMGNNVLEAKVITGDRVGHKVLIPKIMIKPTDPKLPFRMRRRQFPLAVAFAMTINKSQGLSLTEVGLYLPRPVFSHGQLYVALSRVTSKEGLKVLIVDKEGEIQSQTMNVVFKEIFQNLRN